MNKRIEKKLSKRIAQLLPKAYSGAWKDKDISDCLMVGGDLDYWGEGTDEYTAFHHFAYVVEYEWSGMFGFHPDCCQFAGYPLTDKKRKTGKRIIEVAKIMAANNERRFDRPVFKGRMAND